MTSTCPSGAAQDCRIVVTGTGIVSPLGRTPEQFWQSLIEPPPSPTAAEQAGRDPAVPAPGVADFDGHIDEFGDVPAAARKTLRKSLKVMNRETQMGVAAGQQALLSSRLMEHSNPDRVGVCFGAGNVSVMPEDFKSAVRICADAHGDFAMDRWGTDGLSAMAPLWLLRCLPNMPACHLAIINDLRGPSNTITTRDVAFELAVAEACRGIRSNDADAMLVGATGTTLSAFNLMHARLENEVAGETGDPVNESVDAPFPGEGAGALILEKLQAARDRGAHIYGEILGTASASFIGHDGVATCGQALARALRLSLRQARLSPAAIGHIHAHGLGSEAMDQAESQAIADVLGPAALRIPVVATKSRIGNAGAGSGAMEMISSLLALEHGQLFAAHPGDEANSARPVRLMNDPARPVCPGRYHGVGERSQSSQHTKTASRWTPSEAAGDNFLSLSMFGRGLGSCIAVGAFRE